MKLSATKEQREKAQKTCEKHKIKELFTEYKLNRILHWNKELHYYELRARPPNPYWTEKHVAPLAKFAAWTIEQRKARLQLIHNQIYEPQ